VALATVRFHHRQQVGSAQKQFPHLGKENHDPAHEALAFEIHSIKIDFSWFEDLALPPIDQSSSFSTLHVAEAIANLCRTLAGSTRLG